MSRLRDLHVARCVSAACSADGCLYSPASASASASASAFAVRLFGRVRRVVRAGAARLVAAGRQER
ncbi:hypothetical protein GUH05_13720 [Xanthomonas citri pv. citri]|nr:hypothetical protein B7L66_04225 [Xanthomonas citri pv. citri]MBD3959337.1 hypothetical protein [Xanthomonas citri pv. citri]MBD3963334.1 hypothetical protein [Xanthomonas citri pv. citri]MBD3987435.1 hypothetical protein [Xanthomonas citri pv. citri]MBD4008680.1 hypothetical protein [Xanthomonas citri pv. citri]